MNPQYRPGAHAGPLFIPLSLSIALHLALLAWLQPRSGWPPEAVAQSDLRVRLAPRELPVPAPAPPKRTARRPAPAAVPQAAVPQAGPLPPAVEPAHTEPAPPQPLRMRIVANPADYAIASAAPGRPYAWPGGELTDLPFPPDGFPVRYPEEQLHAGQRGLVVVRVDISSAGALEHVDIVCGTGPFDAAVLEALRAVQFRPPLSDHGSVAAWTVLEFAFLAEPASESDKDPRSAEQALDELQKNCERPK